MTRIFNYLPVNGSLRLRLGVSSTRWPWSLAYWRHGKKFAVVTASPPGLSPGAVAAPQSADRADFGRRRYRCTSAGALARAASPSASSFTVRTGSRSYWDRLSVAFGLTCCLSAPGEFEQEAANRQLSYQNRLSTGWSLHSIEGTWVMHVGLRLRRGISSMCWGKLDPG